MNKTRIVFNDDFYKITAIILSTKFKHLKKELIDKYKGLGCAIPKNGFCDYKSYQEWYRKMIKSGYNLGEDINKILKCFNLDTNNEGFRNNLVKEIFLGIKPWKNSIYDEPPIKLITRNNAGVKELWVKIEPMTKKSDYTKLWITIKGVQKTLPGYRAKEKFQKTFKRDFLVYKLFLKTKSVLGDNKNATEILQKMADSPKYNPLLKQFKNKNLDEQLTMIVKRFDNLLKDIDLQ